MFTALFAVLAGAVAAQNTTLLTDINVISQYWGELVYPDGL